MPMKTIEGYSKEKYTNTSVLLAGGGTQALSDFIGSLSWDSTNKKIKYTPVGGSATDLVTLSWDNIANKPTSLPANGGNADTVDNKHASTLLHLDGYYYIPGNGTNSSTKLWSKIGSITFTGAWQDCGGSLTFYEWEARRMMGELKFNIRTSSSKSTAGSTIVWMNLINKDFENSFIICRTGDGKYDIYFEYPTSSYNNVRFYIISQYDNGYLTWQNGSTLTSTEPTYVNERFVSRLSSWVGNADYATSAGTASTVTVNSSDSNSTYRMVWHSDNTLYGTAGIYCNPSTDYLYATSMQTSDWFRSTGNTGWYNNTYGGGWYMEDSTYIRTYNSKCVYNSNTSQYAFYTPGGITVGSHLWGTSTASTWLDGQKEDRAVINVTNSTDANSFWPLIKWTSSSQGRWDTIGVLGNNLYFMSSLTSRTENDYDTAAYFDMTTSRLYSNGVYHTSYGSSAYALTSDGGVAAIANMSVANAENIWLKESSTNSDCRLAFGTYNSTYTALNSSRYLTYNPYSGRLKLKGSKEYNSVNHGGSISFGDGDYLYMKEAKDDVLLQHYRGLISDTQPIAIGFVGSCPSNSSASLVYKKTQPKAVTVTCTRVSSGRFKVGVSNNSGKPIIAHLQVTPVRNYAQYEFAFAYIEDFTMDTADGGMEIASGSTGYFYVRTGRIHCQGTWAAGDYVATGDTGGFTGVVYAMINEDLSTMPTTSW